ncbi:hypothetical protein SAMN04488128_104186 [Chitinophaga eiseniae]|uniref:Uncharacterized protein n=1 Tax=Chitinophaga eiseniae TaxID=634771 RepID=A0A1T4T8M7_9BACT|nr:hypothetical protein SAMN04488128_104186 [Chitinophaga eiseniae]
MLHLNCMAGFKISFNRALLEGMHEKERLHHGYVIGRLKIVNLMFDK